MKNAVKYYFILFFFVLFICNCNVSINDKEIYLYNGIDSQILSITDSVEITNKNYPFVTILCYVRNDSNFISFVGGTVPLNLNKVPFMNDLSFLGYREYNSKYLVFFCKESNRVFNELIKKDSLTKDQRPFEIFKTKKITKFIDPLEEVYFIDKNNQLKFISKIHI